MEDKGSTGTFISHVTMMSGQPGEEARPIEIALIPDGRDCTKVYARPVRTGEETEGVWIEEDETLVVRVEVSHIRVAGRDALVRVVQEGQEGSTIFVRELSPGETDTGETIRFIPGEEKLVFIEGIRYLGMNLTAEVGRKDDLLIGLRLVPDGREGSTVYARTLRPGESDTGQAVYILPGDTLTIREGGVLLDLDDIDTKLAVPFEDGYASITNTLWTWFSIGGPYSPEAIRFLLAAGRRLDASHRLLRSARVGLGELEKVEHGIPLRNLAFEVIGTVEMAVVAMHKAIDMASHLEAKFSVSALFPMAVANKLPSINDIRDAYEHIEERAFGHVRRKHHSDALSGFNFERLFEEQVVTYGSRELDLGDEATQLLIATRQYLKTATAEITSRS